MAIYPGFDAMSTDELKAILRDVLLSSPPETDRDFIEQLAQEIGKREKVALHPPARGR